MAQKRLE